MTLNSITDAPVVSGDFQRVTLSPNIQNFIVRLLRGTHKSSIMSPNCLRFCAPFKRILPYRKDLCKKCILQDTFDFVCSDGVFSIPGGAYWSIQSVFELQVRVC